MTTLAETALVLSLPTLPFGRLFARGARPVAPRRPASRQASLPAGFGSALVLDRWLSDPASDGSLSTALLRAATKNRPVVLGLAGDPYGTEEYPASPRRLLGSLVAAPGLGLSLLTSSPRVAQDLGLLIELDLRHSVTLRLGLPAAGPAAEALWGAAESLAGGGLGVAVAWGPRVVASGGLEPGLRPLFERALAAGVADLTVDPSGLVASEQERVGTLFERLRLQHGFPRVLAGRS
jgi:hypothetical protein